MKKRLPMHVPCPHDERWDAMTPEDGGRRCERCDRHIYDYAQLTRAQTEELKRLSGGTICRKVSFDERGEPIFARKMLRRVVRTAAGLVMTVSLSACGSEAEPQPEPAIVEAPAEPLAPDPVPEPQPVEEPVAEPAPEPVAEAAPEPVEPTEPVAEPEAEPAAEPRHRPHRRRRRPRHEYDEPLVGLDGL